MFNSSGKIALIAAIALPGMARAQETATKLEEIIVTAQRREERLQDVPLSVSALSGDKLARAGITDAYQLTQVMPGLTFSKTSLQFQPYIRGVGTRQGPDESNVSVYLDGVYQPIMGSLGFDLIDVQRVEVLRGPQGTLFGRNATGGLINIITVDPQHEFGGRVAARAGNFGEVSTQLYLTGPVFAGLAGSLSYSQNSDNGYIKDLVRGGHEGARKSNTVRAKLLFDPTDKFRAILSASTAYFDDPISTTNQPFQGNTVVNQLRPTPLYATQPWESAVGGPVGYSWLTGLDLQTRTRFHGFDVATTSSYQKGGSSNLTDNDGSAAPIGGSRSKQPQRFITNEVRLISTADGPFSWIAGGYLFDGRIEFAPLQSYSNGVFLAPFFTRQDASSWAIFGEGNYKFSEHLRFTAGLRYTSEDRKYMVSSPSAVLVPTQMGSSNKLTYRGSLQYFFDEDTNIYFTVSRGFKSGVFNQFATSVANSRYARPEVLDSYEVGLKADPLPWLRMNLSAFHYKYKDIQLNARDPVTNLNLLFNAARSTVKGAEAEITARATPNLNIRAYATYLDANYDTFATAVNFVPLMTLPPGGVPPGGVASQYCPAGIGAPCGNFAVAPFDASGKDMVRAPRLTFGLSADYSVATDIGVLGVSGNAFYSAKSYWDFANRLAQPSYVLLNADVWWSKSEAKDALRIGIWGRNLGNELIQNQILSSAFGDVVVYDRPRSYGVSISKSF